VKKRHIEPDQQIKGSDLIELGNDFVQTLITIVNSKIMKKKFVVDTNIQYLYHMNSKNPPYKLKPGVKVDQSIPDPSQVEQGKPEPLRSNKQRSFKKSMHM
jgi:hypothetical protein